MDRKERDAKYRAEHKAERNEYNRIYRQKNKEHFRQYARDYAHNQGKAKVLEKRQKNQERMRVDPEYRQKWSSYMQIYNRNRRERFRMRIIQSLGGRCQKCGFNDWRALQIDHTNGGGTKHRKSFSSLEKYYEYILANISSGDYQLLCANCNQIKRYRPH